MNNNPYNMAAKWMTLCSALQITLPLVIGFNTIAYQMVVLGVLGLITGAGLLKGWRWLAYLAYIPVMVVAILAMARSFDVAGLASVWYWGIALLDLLTMLALWVALWKNPTPN